VHQNTEGEQVHIPQLEVQPQYLALAGLTPHNTETEVAPISPAIMKAFFIGAPSFLAAA
jgi:hypothetical protein